MADYRITTSLNRFYLRVVRTCQGILRLILPQKIYWKIFSTLLDKLDLNYPVTVNNKKIYFYCPSHIALFRAETLLTKEPHTIKWIEGFQSGDVLLDIGANIGTYTIYAAACCGIRVIAIEPSSDNFSCLCRNIRENGVGDLVYPFCVAGNDREEVTTLHIYPHGTHAGGSGVIFSTEKLSDDSVVKVHDTAYSLGLSIDFLLDAFDLPFPTHIKMDVIGTQAKIIKGAHKLLHDPRLRSAMLEIPTRDPGYGMEQQEDYNYIVNQVKQAGLTLMPGGEGPDYLFERIDT